MTHRHLLLFGLLALPLSGQRLSSDVRPSHYALALDVDIAGRRFSGEGTIDVVTSNATAAIVLNSLGLTIERALIDGVAASVTASAGDEQITMAVPGLLAAGEHRMALAWSGGLSDTDLRGLYLSKSARRAYAVTQFEGTYARMLFPSFDEPGFKATFDLSVIVDAGDTAISNGAILRDEKVGEGRHRIAFATSPKMSTYLVALAVGDFACSSGTEAGVPLRVCSVPEKVEETRSPLEAARAAVRFYQQWFSIRYPFGKLDLVAIPDYEWGGMENTGSIFFRESALLVGKNPSGATKQSLAGLVAHEIAHQWFGDLVTAAWWDDIWLNEGFATWMALKPVAAWHPEWPTTDEAARATQSAIGVDSLSATRAIHATATTPGEIKEMFDGIAYEKGAALLRMLEAYVGPETFRAGVNAYLAEHASGNATSGDFAAALARASGKPIDAILRTFVTQPGVPLVTFTRTCAGGRGSITMTQQRFTLNGTATAPQRWSIPVCMKVGEGTRSTTRCELLDGPSMTIETPGCSSWIDANAGALGYYRSSYTASDAIAVAKHARTALTPPERVGLVEDAWAGVRAGKAEIGPFLEIAAGLTGERVRAVIGSVSSKLFFIRERLLAEGDAAKLDPWMRRIFAPAAQAIGWVPAAKETDAQRELRATLLRVLGTAGDPAALKAARGLVDAALTSEASKDTALLDAAFDVVARRGDAALYERIVARLPKAANVQEHYRLLYALTAFPRPELAARTLDLMKTDVVRVNDYPAFLAQLLGNAASRDAAWAFLKEHWEDLRTKVISFGGRGAIPALGTTCSAAFRTDVAAFFASHPAPGAERALAQSLEQIDACLSMRERHAAALHAWIARH